MNMSRNYAYYYTKGTDISVCMWPLAIWVSQNINVGKLSCSLRHGNTPIIVSRIQYTYNHLHDLSVQGVMLLANIENQYI